MKRDSIIQILLCSLLLTLISSATVAQKINTAGLYLNENYILEQWSVEEGLPVNTVYDIHKASTGYLWLTTHDGLVRFDGIDFKIYSAAEYKGLPGNRIQRLEEANDGSLIIQSEGIHITRFRDEQFSPLLSINSSMSGNGSGKTLYKDTEGKIWIGGDDGIYIFDKDSLIHFKPDLIKHTVLNILHVANDEVWFGISGSNTLMRYKNGIVKEIAGHIEGKGTVSFHAIGDTYWMTTNHRIYRFRNEKLDTVITNLSLNFLASGSDLKETPLFMTDNQGYFKLENEKLFPLKNIPQKTPSIFPPFRVDNKGNFWLMTYDQIFRNGVKLMEGSNYIVEDVIEDEEGNIWIGTTLHGLLRLKPKLFTTFSQAQGLPGRSIYPVFQSKDSSVWVGSFGQGIARIKKNVVETGYSINNNTDWGHIQTFTETPDGTILLSALGQGLLTLNRETKKTNTYPTPAALIKSQVFSLFIDSKERLWVGASPVDAGGLYVKDGNEWTLISGSSGVPNTKVRGMSEAWNGDIWFTTQGNGVIRYDNSRFYTYDTKSGLSSDFPRAIHFSEDEETGTQVLWVGYEDKGLDRIELNQTTGTPDLESITNVQTRDGLFDNSVHIIIEDDNKRFWINTNRGIFWVAKSELDAFHFKRIHQVYSRGYTEEDGLLNREGNGGIYPAGVKDHDGVLWLPTQNGVVSFHPDSIIRNKEIPPVVIQTVNSKEYVLSTESAHIKLPADQRDLEISYAVLSFLNSKKNQYRYILEGYDQEWNIVAGRRTAYYTNLPDGNYTFRVQGSNNEGLWNEEGASLNIIVAPYFYETLWFYLSCILALGGIAMTIVWVRNRNFERREIFLKREVGLRTQELVEEKNKTELQAKKLKEIDEVKSRFFTNISHELRTPLTLIIGPLESLVNDNSEATGSTFTKQKEMMLRNSKRLLNLIDQLLDVSRIESGIVALSVEPVLIFPFLRKNIAYFSEAIDTKKIILELTSSALSQEVFIDPEKMEKVIANLINNAIKFTPEGGKILIQLKDDPKEFTITVTDTGVGIDPDQLQKIFDRFYQTGNSENRSTQGFGIGLSIAKELIELHSGTITVNSEPGKGTSFVLTLLKGTSHYIANGIKINPFNNKIDNLSHFIPEDSLFEDQPEFPVNHNEDTTTILVIDDHIDMRFYVSSILSDSFRIIEAQDGEQALKKIEANPPDLIIADVMMPNMDGMELNRRLKTDPETSSIPFIFLTAKIDQGSRISGIEQGADFYLTKPFNSKELIVTVENLIDSRHRLRERLLKEVGPVIPSKNKYERETDPFFIQLYDIMEKEYSNPELSVNMIQEKMFMSRSTFYRAMNEKTGLNTQQFVNLFRLEKAQEMLLHEDGNISEIAYACGFNSLSYFSRAFKDKFGKTPSEYLKTYS